MWIWALIPFLALQPDPVAMRKLFEDALSRRTHEYGETDARTAQAARDLGLFLVRSGDALTARKALTNAVHLDEKALGPSAPQTLEDVATLASISPRAEAEPLLRRASESSDPIVAGPALTSLAEMRKAAGDAPGAAVLLRRAVEKAEAVDGAEGLTVALVLKALALVSPPKDAIPVLQRALAIHQGKLGSRSAETLADARQLANLLRATGRVAEAAALERQLGLAGR